MGRLLILLGVALFIVAMASIFFFTQTTSNDTVAEIFTAIACEEGEYLQERIEWGSGLEINDRPTAFYCISGDGINQNERQVNGPITLVVAVTFVVPLLLGILLFIGGVGRAASSQTRKLALSSAVNLRTRDDGTVDIYSNNPDLSPETLDMVEKMVNNISGSHIKNGNELVDKLQQIESAYKQGLISSAEYQRLRQETLDDFNP